MSKELDPKEQVRSAWARIGTLPKWAQDEMQRLQRENTEIRAFHESLTQAATPEARAEHGIWVPSKPILTLAPIKDIAVARGDDMMSLQVGTRRSFNIRWQRAERAGEEPSLRIHASDSVLIQPSSSNSIYLTFANGLR